MTASRRGPRIVLGVGIVAGLLSAVGLATARPEQVGIATDVYYHAASTFLSGGDFYAVRPPDHPAFAFLYPPILVLAFVPHALTGSPLGAYALQTAINLATAGAFAVVVLRSVERAGVELDRLDRGLLAGYAVGFFGVSSVLVMGQVNLQLALALALGVLWLEAGAEVRSGIAFAGAALVKLFPALLGAWLLRRRAWRAVLAATAAGIGALLAGVLVLGPDATVTYFVQVVVGEATTGSFAEGPNADSPYMTIRRQLAFLFSGLPADVRSALGGLVLVPVVLACYRSLETYRDRLVAFGATILAVLHFLPLEPFYLSLAVFPLAPLLYLFDPGLPRRLYLPGILVLSLPIRMDGVELWAGLLPDAVGSSLVTLANATFPFALPQTYGLWLVLAAFVIDQHRAATGEGTESEDQSSAAPVSGR